MTQPEKRQRWGAGAAPGLGVPPQQPATRSVRAQRACRDPASEQRLTGWLSLPACFCRSGCCCALLPSCPAQRALSAERPPRAPLQYRHQHLQLCVWVRAGSQPARRAHPAQEGAAGHRAAGARGGAPLRAGLGPCTPSQLWLTADGAARSFSLECTTQLRLADTYLFHLQPQSFSTAILPLFHSVCRLWCVTHALAHALAPAAPLLEGRMRPSARELTHPMPYTGPLLPPVALMQACKHTGAACMLRSCRAVLPVSDTHAGGRRLLPPLGTSLRTLSIILQCLIIRSVMASAAQGACAAVGVRTWLAWTAGRCPATQAPFAHAIRAQRVQPLGARRQQGSRSFSGERCPLQARQEHRGGIFER